MSPERSLNYGDGNKPNWALLLDDFSTSLNEVLKAREYGANKYSRFNWLASCGTEDHDGFLAKNRASMFRHLLDMKNGDIDDESGYHHAAMLALRCLIHMEYSERRRRETEDSDTTCEAEAQGD